MRVMGYHPQLDSAIWPGSGTRTGTSASRSMYGYDPAKAKALLAQAGYPQGFEFTLYLYTLPGLPEIIDIGQAMALDFQAIGLKPKLVEIGVPQGAGTVPHQGHPRSVVSPTRHAARALEVARNRP